MSHNADTLEPLELDESRRLIDLEGIIQRGQKAFIEVGTALSFIRDERLYRADYATFEAYCKGKWGWSASRARQICSAASFAKSVTSGNGSESVTTCSAPKSEREARRQMKAQRDALKSPQDQISKSAPAMVAAFDAQQIPAPPVELSPLAIETIEAVNLGSENLRALKDCILGGCCDDEVIVQVVDQLGEVMNFLMDYQIEINRNNQS